MILEEERRPTAGGERTKAICVLHLPHFTGKNLDLGSQERTPSDERRAAGSPAIKTMAIAQLLRCLKRSIAHTAAQTTSFDRRLHPASTRSRLLEPFGNEMRARVDIGLAKRTVADINEAVGCASGDDGNVARAHLSFLIADDASSLSLLHDNDLLVRVLMQTRTLPGRGVDEEEGDAHASMIVANELVRHSLER